MGWSRLLKNGKLTREQSVHAIEALERGINSQKQIIEDLLDVSRIVAGKLHLERKIVPLDVVILHAIDAIKPAAANKGVELRVEAEPVELFADENRIQQVLWNLLNNAIKFTLLGGHVKLVAKKVNSNCVITVTDTGRGIEPAFLPYLFDRFTQFDSSASRDTGGLGLGLAISRSLIEKHGGEITASSEGLGKGSTFTVKLPAYLAIHSNSEAQEKPLETQQTIRLDDTHILLIEDQLDTQELISLIVRTAGATITAVNSTDSALSAYLAKRPSILICDVGLPGEDGYTFMRRFRIFEKSLGWSVPTLALTAHAREDDRWNALKAGYQAHLGKPFDTNTLLQVISNLIGHSRKE
jgi:CheY-like chemotaxis protein